MIMQRLVKMVGVVALLVLAGASIGSAARRPVPDAPEAQPMRPSCQACSDGVNSCIEDGIAPETCQKAFQNCFKNCIDSHGAGAVAGEADGVSKDGEPGSN
jgi:hypothetical protein